MNTTDVDTLQPGDILLVMSEGPLSDLIAWASDGAYSHAALVAGLVALGIGPGDEVIVPAYTYISTAMAVVEAGAMPVIAEVDETLTLSPADVRKKITPHTKAMIPVHIQGFPCNMGALMEIARENNIAVLEDACQADGGAYKGKRLGTIGSAINRIEDRQKIRLPDCHIQHYSQH